MSTAGYGPRPFIAPAPPANAPRAEVRLSLHDELYLFAHHAETGTAHIHTAPLSIGLAGAVLIELLTEGWVTFSGERLQLQLTQAVPADTILAAGLASIRTGPWWPNVAPWLRGFGDPELYRRVRANLVAVGILRHQARRLRADLYPAVHHAWTTRVMGRTRSVLTGWDQADGQSAALCGLIDALGLQEHLLMGEVSAQVRHALRVVASGHFPPVRYVTSCVAQLIGDLATAVYS
jgi:Golgi phosphoprotein 3 (GPP34)